MISKLHSVFVLLVVLLSLEQVFGYSNMTVTVGKNHKGVSFYCKAIDYQLCHRMEPIASKKAAISSAIFTHKDKQVKDVSVTFYTGKSCDGQWFRKTGSMKYNQSWKWSNFGKYNEKIRSFKIANFKTSNGNSGSNKQSPNGNYYTNNCEIIRYK
ncbi:hypothetical protein BJ944DRAFT_266653 [Cunninghamella echinulata]|nr:hypothetical protein BJ944DRAFT_266653 [Cunninghamella echinulata]